MTLPSRDYLILLQNLTNRATDIEISNANLEKRTVKFENIEANVQTLKKFIGSEIVAHEAKCPPKPEYKPSFKGKNNFKKF